MLLAILQKAMRTGTFSCSQKSLTSAKLGEANLSNGRTGRRILIGSPKRGRHALRSPSLISPARGMDLGDSALLVPIAFRERVGSNWLQWCQPVCRSTSEFGSVLTRLQEGQDLGGRLKAP